MDENRWQGNGWTSYQKLVLSKLEDHQEELKAVNKRLADLQLSIVELKVKASVWGMVAGGIAGLLPFVIELIVKK